MSQYDEVFLVGGRPLRVHRQEYCQGRNCSIHNPSDHPLNSSPHIWRGDRGLMERECEHGIGHPDPDDLAFKKRIGHQDVYSLGLHGCDGCCRPERKPMQAQLVKRELTEPWLVPVVRWLDGGLGTFIRLVLGLQALFHLFFLLLGSPLGAANFILMLFGAAFYSGTFFLVRSYKHHHSQYFRRSNG